MASLQYLISRTLKPLRTQKAYKEAMLLHDWETVVGTEFSKKYFPVGIYHQASGKVLKLITSSSGMAMARYIEAALLERVNQFFGFPYIASIKMTQGRPLTSFPRKREFKNSEQNNVTIHTLDEALQALGKHLNAL